MFANNVTQQNFSSDGEDRPPRDETFRYHCSHFSRLNRIRRPGETLNSRTLPVRNLSRKSWTRDCTVGETSRTDRIPNMMPIGDQDQSDEDDDWMCSDDEYVSDDLSLETAKKSKWLKDFFEWLDSLRKDQINDQTLMMHCPACKGGAGAVAQYRGFQRVLQHARTVRSKQMTLHRRFAEILDGELKNRLATSLVLNKKELPEWKGLSEEVGNPHMIVWPPMVIVQNTRSHRDENEMWVGMTNQELENCFKEYNISKVKSAYGPSGHCGVSLLIFPSSAAGYLEAEYLHRQFLKEGRGKNEWQILQSHRHSERDRLLYGYMATEGDIELFDKHSKEKKNQKFEIKPYKMMVVDPFKKMEDNDHKLIQLEEKVARETQENKILTETCDVNRQKLHLREIEIQTIRRRASEEHEELKKEIECLDNFYADTIKQLTDSLEKVVRECEEMKKSSHMLSNHCNESTSVA